MNKILFILLLFIVGCGSCNTFLPKEELNHYYLGGALRGADCLKKHKPTDKMGAWLNCVQDRFDDNFPYYVEFHQTVCKYKLFKEEE